MKVTAAEISEQFDALMSRRRAREDVEHWAAERMRANDEHRLEFDPPDDEQRLWNARSMAHAGVPSGPRWLRRWRPGTRMSSRFSPVLVRRSAQ